VVQDPASVADTEGLRQLGGWAEAGGWSPPAREFSRRHHLDRRLWQGTALCANWAVVSMSANVPAFVSGFIPRPSCYVSLRGPGLLIPLPARCHGHLPYTVLSGTRRQSPGTATRRNHCKSAPRLWFSAWLRRVQSLSRLLLNSLILHRISTHHRQVLPQRVPE
jgi:hypothetical protein